MEQAKVLAKIHAEKDLPAKGDGYEVISFSVGNSVFGSMNEDGKEVGKQSVGTEKRKRASSGGKRGRKPGLTTSGKKPRKSVKDN